VHLSWTWDHCTSPDRPPTLSLATSQLQVERTEKQVNAGALPLQNLLQARQQTANDEVNVITAENSLELSRLSLKQALQLPASTELEIDVPEVGDPDVNKLSTDLEAISQTAFGNMPEIKSAEAQVRSSYHGIKIARSGRYPTLTLGAGFGTSYSSAAPDQLPKANSLSETVSQPIGYVNVSGTDYNVFRDTSIPLEFINNSYFNQLDFNLSRFVSLTLNIPIFNRFQSNTNISQAKLTWENSKYIQTNTTNQLRQNIEQAFYNARAAAKTYSATSRQVEALEESFRNVEQRFNLGSANSVEYNQIKNDYNRAKNDLIRSKYDFIFKQKVLDFYQGLPLEF
jgi:outer membrane protein